MLPSKYSIIQIKMRFEPVLLRRRQAKKLKEKTGKDENGVFEEKVFDHRRQSSIVPVTMHEQ